MAQVLIEAHHLLQAVGRTVNALTPPINQVRSAWRLQESQLNEMKAAADWAISHGVGSKLIALDSAERSLIEPYIDGPLG